MSKSATTSIEAYEFRSDFEQNAETVQSEPPHVDQVTMDAAELAGLLTQARSEGIAEALAAKEREETQRLEGISAQLNDALANLVELAGHLDAASNDAALAEKSLALINAAAKQIVDGQGDLFSELQPSRGGVNRVETSV